jgi:hypothetical protein
MTIVVPPSGRCRHLSRLSTADVTGGVLTELMTGVTTGVTDDNLRSSFWLLSAAVEVIDGERDRSRDDRRSDWRNDWSDDLRSDWRGNRRSDSRSDSRS